jgi:hypothetical protein
MPLPPGGKAVRGPTSRKPEDLPVERRQWCPGPGHAAGQAQSARAEPSCVSGPTHLCPDREEGYLRIMLTPALIARFAGSPAARASMVLAPALRTRSAPETGQAASRPNPIGSLG